MAAAAMETEMLFVVLQFLNEEKFKEAALTLGKESGIYFDMEYFETGLLRGEWDEMEKYFSWFTKATDNPFSMKSFYEIRKYKYLDNLDRGNTTKALEILMNELKEFQMFNEDMYEEMARLVTLEDFRTKTELWDFKDAISMKARAVVMLRQLIKMNPIFHNKLEFPAIMNSRLKRLTKRFIFARCNPNQPIDLFPLPPPPPVGSFPSLRDDFPITVVANIYQGSAVKCMDFNPVAQTLLLVLPVGTNAGGVALWELSVKKQIAFRAFNVWGGIGFCSAAVQDFLANEYTAAVNRVKWNPEGRMFGVAYSKHIVRLYNYLGEYGLQEAHQIVAHVGSVNDLAFCWNSVLRSMCIVLK